MAMMMDDDGSPVCGCCTVVYAGQFWWVSDRRGSKRAYVYRTFTPSSLFLTNFYGHSQTRRLPTRQDWQSPDVSLSFPELERHEFVVGEIGDSDTGNFTRKRMISWLDDAVER